MKRTSKHFGIPHNKMPIKIKARIPIFPTHSKLINQRGTKSAVITTTTPTAHRYYTRYDRWIPKPRSTIYTRCQYTRGIPPHLSRRSHFFPQGIPLALLAYLLNTHLRIRRREKNAPTTLSLSLDLFYFRRFLHAKINGRSTSGASLPRSSLRSLTSYNPGAPTRAAGRSARTYITITLGGIEVHVHAAQRLYRASCNSLQFWWLHYIMGMCCSFVGLMLIGPGSSGFWSGKIMSTKICIQSCSEGVPLNMEMHGAGR